MNKDKGICYILNPSNIESVLTCEYLCLNLKSYLHSIVLHQQPKTDNEKFLVDNINKMLVKGRLLGMGDVEISDQVEGGPTAIFCGAPLTKVAQYINNDNYIDYLIIAGGYVAPHFTYGYSSQEQSGHSDNFDNDFNSTEQVLQSTFKQIDSITLVGCNITLSKVVEPTGKYWADDELAQHLFKRYNITKRVILENLVACKEGMASYLRGIAKSRVQYVHANPLCQERQSYRSGIERYWCTVKNNFVVGDEVPDNVTLSSYRQCKVAKSFMKF